MINLTEHPITLIRAGGEATTIEPSGYIARVEYELMPAKTGHCSYTFPDPLPPGFIPIVEQTPREIVFDENDAEIAQKFLTDIVQKGESASLFLVTREVAEAAAHMRHKCSKECPHAQIAPNGGLAVTCKDDNEPHPLADRMVWADGELRDHAFGGLEFTTIQHFGYRELRRVRAKQ